jgi:dolichol-phosphate mannosyltransferase
VERLFTLDYWRRFIKFNLVGLSGVIVNEGLLVLLASAGLYYLYASAVAVETSIISNFILHDFWTFRDRRHGKLGVRLAKFNGLMLAGLAVNLAILFGGTEYLRINYALSNLAGIAVAFLVRYWLSVKYTWIRKEEESVVPPPSAQPTLR